MQGGMSYSGGETSSSGCLGNVKDFFWWSLMIVVFILLFITFGMGKALLFTGLIVIAVQKFKWARLVGLVYFILELLGFGLMAWGTKFPFVPPSSYIWMLLMVMGGLLITMSTLTQILMASTKRKLSFGNQIFNLDIEWWQILLHPLFMMAGFALAFGVDWMAVIQPIFGERTINWKGLIDLLSTLFGSDKAPPADEELNVLQKLLQKIFGGGG